MTSLRPPSDDGFVRYYERRPVRRFKDLVLDLLAEDRDFDARSFTSPRRAMTTEGEVAAWIAVDGVFANERAARFIGAVYADDFIAAIDALAFTPRASRTIIATARELLAGVSLGLGVRRRRFYYAPPPGWTGIAAGGETSWMPPDFPRHRAIIVVPPAEPCADAASVVADRFLEDEQQRGFMLSGIVNVKPFAPDRPGAITLSYAGSWRRDRPIMTHHAVIATDGRYRTVLRLETLAAERLDEDCATLHAAARSVEPPAAPGAGARPHERTLRVLSELWSE